MTFKLSLCQMNSGNDMAANIRQAETLVEQAKETGARLAMLPENCAFMAASANELHENAYGEEKHPMVRSMQERAKAYKLWILIGSVAVPAKEKGRLSNRSLLIDDEGKITARYDKIHLYDADVKGGERHRESEHFVHGNKAVIAPTPFATLGLSVCYDLRFAYLYRALAKAGAQILTVPSAFTAHTGKAHWHTLLKARAIETGCFVCAPAQVGEHPRNRKTYGHSLMVDPWGEVLGDGGDEVGVVTAEIDLSRIEEVRNGLPCLQHDREIGIS